MAKYDRLAKMFEQMDAEEVSEVLQLFEECLDVYQKSYNKGVRQIAAITVVMSGFVAFVTKTTIYDIEFGRINPFDYTLSKLATALNVDIEDFK